MTLFVPTYPPCDPTDKNGFSYETVLKRWPIILTKLIDHIHRVNHELTMAATRSSTEGSVDPNWETRVEEGKAIIEKVSKLKYEMARDRALHTEGSVDPNWETRVEEGKAIIEKVSKLKYEMARDRALQPIGDDGEADVGTYNLELAKLGEQGKNTWFTAPWLYAECNLYRLLRSWFAITTYWRYYDPFLSGKEDSFKASSAAIYKLAATMHEFEETKAELEEDPSKLDVLFNEMIQMCLWGNATDLSLLTNLTHEDILKLQSVGKEAQDERKAFILRDDEKVAFEYLTTLKDARVDFILDNDLVFADFLVTYTPYVSKVVFHPKSIPWFVSDVTPPDFRALFTSLRSESFFLHDAPSGDARIQLSTLLTRWEQYVEKGAFALSVPLETKLGEKNEIYDFWTAPNPYWDMIEKAPKLFESLKQSGLVIFKARLTDSGHNKTSLVNGTH
ncbi:DUF89 domain-containing protein [Sanghuangporus baumii]|uniref:Sugar phosphate phosphatase n=1 Tax=Sanghuangporus baumii TaxID=108892 RepID=A0A9Q5HXY1_SANBA|nr:DUF89 domain-containing protein [Sanghuangporus baumii]